MNRRVVFTIIGGLILPLICFLSLILCNITGWEQELDEIESIRWPNYLSSYGSEVGYYKINPETILVELGQGNADVFVPLPNDPDLDFELTDSFISWKQEDFLMVARVLGQTVWGDPMDLKEWSVFHITFSGTCEDGVMGFDSASITYFKTIEECGREVYTTRRVENDPSLSVIRWGSGETYSTTFFHRWTRVELADAKITAADALQIVLKSDRRKEYLQERNSCRFFVGSPQGGYNESWYVDYDLSVGSLRYIVDLDTGEYTFLNSGR